MAKILDRGVVAIVGRPNVGKSTLFNRIAGTRLAIEEPTPGVTRDRIYADCEWMRKRFVLIDTGGLQTTDAPLQTEIVKQVQFAIEEADVVIFVVDAKVGEAGFDEDIAEMLRRTGKPAVVAVNKVDSSRREEAVPDFYRLALKDLIPVSAAHGLGIDELLDAVVAFLPETEPQGEEDDVVRVAIVGRPNVGKSSLLNAIVGEERMVVDSVAGTTRDAIDTPYEWKERKLILIDTAGIRRKTKVKEDFEYYSVLRAFGAIDRCDVVLTLIDAQEGLTDQDKRIAGRAHQEGRAQLLVVSKWDLLSPQEEGKPAADKEMMRKFGREVEAWLPEISYAPVVFVSSLERRGLEPLLDTVLEAADHHSHRFQTAELNRILEEATYQHPLSRKGREIKIYYATQVATRPPTLALFMNSPELMHFSSLAYLENRIRTRAPLEGTPIRFSLRASHGREDKRRR
jgi:GTPase